MSGPKEPIVRVWHVDLDRPRFASSGYQTCLDEDERVRAARYRSAPERARFLAARSTLRHVLSAVIGAAAERIVFRSSATGKLECADTPWQFSLSHSHGYAVVAVANEIRVGVDVERIDKTYAELRDVATLFTAQERESIGALPPTEATDAFYRCWTRKEAVLKAVGSGISDGLHRIAVTHEPEVSKLLWTDGSFGNTDRWFLFDLDLPPFATQRYAAALATEGNPPRIVTTVWE